MSPTDFQLYDMLAKQGVDPSKYSMRQLLKLSIFKGCTWDIFYLSIDGQMVRLRVQDVSFNIFPFLSPRVSSFGPCYYLRNGNWELMKKVTPRFLNQFLFKKVDSPSQEVHGPGNKLHYVAVTQLDTFFRKPCLHAVFYPHGVDPDCRALPSVWGWKGTKALATVPSMNEMQTVKTSSGYVVV